LGVLTACSSAVTLGILACCDPGEHASPPEPPTEAVLGAATDGAIQRGDLRLPRSTADGPVRLAVEIQLTTSEMIVDGVKVTDVTGGQVAEEYKRGTMLMPLYDVLQEKADNAKAIAERNPDFEFSGRVLLVCDGRTPWPLMREVLYTAGQAQFGEYCLVTADADAGCLACLDLALPEIRAPRAEEVICGDGEELCLTLVIGARGYWLDGNSELLPGDIGATPSLDEVLQREPTLARDDEGGWPIADLGTMAQTLKAQHPTETRIHVHVDTEMLLDDLVSTLDAARGPGSEARFPDVVLGTAPRFGGESQTDAVAELMRLLAEDGGLADLLDSTPTQITLTVSVAEVTGGLAAADSGLDTLVARKRGQLQACAEQRVKAGAHVSGRLELAIAADADGRVTTVEVVQDDVGDPDLVGCYERRAKRWRLPASDEASTFRLTCTQE